MKYGYRTFVAKVEATQSFDGSTNGSWDISRWGPDDTRTLRDYVPHIIVAWNTADLSSVDDVRIELVDPDDAASRIVFVDEVSASVGSKVTPSDGRGHPVPMRNQKALCYELRVTTSASATAGQSVTVELWWEPRWQASWLRTFRRIGEMVCRMLGLREGVDG